MKSRIVFRSSSDRWSTPQAVYTALDAEFQFDLDPCPLDGHSNGLGSLLCSWYGRRVFVNPPYGPRIGEWLARAQEAALAVYLLPARTDTRWFHTQVLPQATEIRFLRGRLTFGQALHSAPFPSMVVIYRNTPLTPMPLAVCEPS